MCLVGNNQKARQRTGPCTCRVPSFQLSGSFWHRARFGLYAAFGPNAFPSVALLSSLLLRPNPYFPETVTPDALIHGITEKPKFARSREIAVMFISMSAKLPDIMDSLIGYFIWPSSMR